LTSLFRQRMLVTTMIMIIIIIKIMIMTMIIITAAIVSRGNIILVQEIKGTPRWFDKMQSVIEMMK